jgi:hypothetical protein
VAGQAENVDGNMAAARMKPLDDTHPEGSLKKMLCFCLGDYVLRL